MSETRRVRRSQLPALVSGSVTLLNAAGGALRALGVSLGRISEEHLLQAARQKTGLADFGDEGFRTPLRMLIRACDEEGELGPIGRLMIRRRILMGLVNRLCLTDELKRQPEILRAPIRRPIFIVSLPRTGTTLLHNLLTQDPQARPILAWEGMAPARHPAEIGLDPDPRIKRARRLAKVVTSLVPAARAIHDVDPDGPVECGMLLQNTFVLASQMAPTYREWFLRQPAAVIETAYREYRQQLQLLHCQRPHDGHWVLKAPVHLYAIDALLTLFREAAIILIHRDPARVIPSTCSLMSILRDVMGGDPERRDALGPQVVAWAAEGLRRAEAARAHAEPGRIYDLDYRELVADPIGAVRGLYAKFDYPYTDAFEIRATAWLRAHPQHKHGAHRYDLAQFGLDHRMIDDAFAWYRARHHIPLESPSSDRLIQ